MFYCTMLSGYIKGTASATNQLYHHGFIYIPWFLNVQNQLISLDSVNEARNQIHPLT